MNSPLRLDWKGDAEVAPDARLVETEVQWLQVAPTLRAPDADGVCVRGAALCCANGGGTCEEVRNALDALLALVPKLERAEAETIADALGARGHDGALHLREMLAVLFPDFGDGGALWKRNHTADNRLEIAASWLLWLAEQGAIETSHAKLIERQCEIWRASNREWDDLFPATAGAARSALRFWLGLETQNKRGAFAARPAFPLTVPSAWLLLAFARCKRAWT